MASKSIDQLTTAQCSDYCKTLERNAQEQWEIALTIAANEKYGVAASHLLISIEESVKSMIVHLDSIGYEFRFVKGINVIFGQHKIRFFIAYLMLGVSIFGDDFIRWIRKMSKSPHLLKAELTKFTSKDDEIPGRLKFYLLKKYIVLRREMTFFKDADVARQLGFYVDYKENIQSPQKMPLETYTEIFTRLERVNKIIIEFKAAFDIHSEEMRNLIEENKAMFKEKQLYKQFGQWLPSIRSKPDKPFNFLEGIFKMV